MVRRDLHPGRLLVVARHERPRRVLGAAAGHHVVHREAVVVPFLPVPPVLVGDLVPLVGDGFPLLEAPQLLLGADVDPELAQDDAALGELLLEFVGLEVGPAPVLLGVESFDALDERVAVPGAEEDPDAAPAGHRPPEAVIGRPLALLVARLQEGVGLAPPGIRATR